MRFVAASLLAVAFSSGLPGIAAAGDAQGDKQAHKAPQKQAQKQPDKQASRQATKPGKKPAQNQARKPVQKPVQKQAQKPAGKPVEQSPVAALPADENADGFLNLYVELCVRHFGDLEEFRARLLQDKVPKVPAEDAQLFLSGMEGDAWPVPYKGEMGNYVLALPAGKNLCLLHARRANAAAVEKGFLDIVADAPSPMVARRGPAREQVTEAKLRTRTVSSTWAPPDARRKMEFMLTTTASDKAELQVLGSVAMIAGDEKAPVKLPVKAKAAPSARQTQARPHARP
jgi:hypothetical protein